MRPLCIGFMNFLAWAANASGEEVQPMQSGRIQAYVLWFMAGIIVLTLMLLLCV